MEMSTKKDDTSSISVPSVAPTVSENNPVSTSEPPVNGVVSSDVSWPVEVCGKLDVTRCVLHH